MSAVGTVVEDSVTEVTVSRDGETSNTYRLSVLIEEERILGKDNVWGTGRVIGTTATDPIVVRRHFNNPKTVYIGKVQ